MLGLAFRAIILQAVENRERFGDLGNTLSVSAPVEAHGNAFDDNFLGANGDGEEELWIDNVDETAEVNLKRRASAEEDGKYHLRRIRRPGTVGTCKKHDLSADRCGCRGHKCC